MIFFDDPKINQHSRSACLWHNNVGRFDIPVNERGLLSVKIGNGLDDWRHDRQNLRQRKTLSGLLPAQNFQIWSLDIIHEHVSPVAIFKYVMYTGQCLV